jgi:hypothetical protein
VSDSSNREGSQSARYSSFLLPLATGKCTKFVVQVASLWLFIHTH